MKNHRYVCAARQAGYAEFKGLIGRIQTGCPKTPAHKSPYCSVHKPSVGVRHNHMECDGTSTSNKAVSTSEEHPVGMIIDKRITRNSTLYEVHKYVCMGCECSVFALPMYVHVLA